jgi:predicted lipase
MIDILDQVCIQECINLRGGSHGKVIEVLKNKNFVQHGHTEFSVGKYEDKYIITFMSSKGIKDWIDNLKFCKETDKIDTFKASVHQGFKDQWDFIYPFVAREMKYIDSVIFNGHSLGGALATMATLHYMKSKKIDIRTFGSPRVMDFKTAKYFNKNIEFSKRFTYKQDVVTHLPTVAMNFCHIKGHIALGKISFLERLNIFDNAQEHEEKYYRDEIIKKVLDYK